MKKWTSNVLPDFFHLTGIFGFSALQKPMFLSTPAMALEAPSDESLQRVRVLQPSGELAYDSEVSQKTSIKELVLNISKDLGGECWISDFFGGSLMGSKRNDVMREACEEFEELRCLEDNFSRMQEYRRVSGGFPFSKCLSMFVRVFLSHNYTLPKPLARIAGVPLLDFLVFED